MPLNRAQRRAVLTLARETYNIWPRGQGKTMAQGVVSSSVSHYMPRGKAAFIARTLIDLKALVLPEVIATWKRLGYIEDVHFVVGKKPPKALQFKEPIQPPIDYQHFITWYNGFGFHLVGQDRPGTFRGPSVDFLFPDEMLTLKKDHLESEVMAANRGNKNVFGHLPFHHGIFACSSKPVGSSDRWILDFGKYYLEDGVNYSNILSELVELEIDFIDCGDPKRRRRLWAAIEQLTGQLKYYVKDGVYYNECRVWNNIMNLGWAWLKLERRTMSLFKFMVEILNHTLNKVEGGFYGQLRTHIHCYYDANNYSFIDSLGYNPDKLLQRDARFDSDYDTNMPIRIGQDWGLFNCMVVAQRHPTELKVINGFHVEHPKILDHVIESFCHYYRFHKERTIFYRPGHDGFKRTPNKELTYVQQAMQILHKHGWNVILQGSAASPDPEKTYYDVNRVLLEQDPDIPFVVRINGNNCEHLVTSMQLAPVKQGTRSIAKDKSSEKKDSGVAPHDATHYSDAFDMILRTELEVGSYSVSDIPDIVM